MTSLFRRTTDFQSVQKKTGSKSILRFAKPQMVSGQLLGVFPVSHIPEKACDRFRVDYFLVAKQVVDLVPR